MLKIGIKISYDEKEPEILYFSFDSETEKLAVYKSYQKAEIWALPGHVSFECVSIEKMELANA